jgi:hypothetical protein
VTRIPYAFLGVSAALAVGVGLTASVPAAPAPRRASAEPQPVLGAIAVCPELVKAGGDITTQLTLGTAGPGEIRVRAASLVAGSGQGPVVLSEGGRISTFSKPGDQAVAVAATAVGPLSGGLEAEQVSRGVDGLQRGLAGTRCEGTSADTWFVGGATTAGVATQLMLVNPYDDDALVDVELYGKGGRIEAPGAEGILVEGRERRVVDLAELAPDESALALHVLAREGRISPAVRDARVHGETPWGVDWVPRAGRPSSVVDLPGVAPGNGRRVLYVAAPGEDNAEFSVQLTLSDGQVVPTGYDLETVLAGRVVALDMTKAIAGRSTSIRVQAEGAPVLASMLVENRARYNPIQEFAYVGAARALDGPAVITDARVGEDLDSFLFLSSPDGPSTVDITMLPIAKKGEPRLPAPRRVSIPQGRLVVVKFSGKPNRVARKDPLRPFVVTPVSGSPVFAARIISEIGLRGPLFTALTVVSQDTDGVPGVPVVEDLGISLGDQPELDADEVDLDDTEFVDDVDGDVGTPTPSGSPTPR